jgi:hypothetical protein
LFLAGKGNLFAISTPFVDLPPDAAGTRALKRLKFMQRDYDWLVLAVDQASLQIRGSSRLTRRAANRASPSIT